MGEELNVNIVTGHIVKAFRKLSSQPIYIVFVLLFAIIGPVLLIPSHALTPTVALETENGTPSSCAGKLNDTSASGGSAIKFGTCVAAASSGNPSADAGASLPLQYSLSTLAGSVLYVSPTGSDSGSGTVGAPYATLAKAISASASGGTIVLRGGTYRQGGITIGKSLKVMAYPGETPVFNGATAVSGGWTVSGDLSYRSYTPVPVTTGSGITFSSCQNQTSSCVGQYPDQVWIGTTQLQQVTSQASVTAGTFYVDQTNNRLYLETSDINKGNVEISGQRTFASVSAPNVTLKGFKVIRYSNNGSDYGVISFDGAADNALVDNIFESDTAYMAISFTPSDSDLNENSTVKDSTIVYSNWMGIGSNATNYFTLDHSIVGNMNQFGEFTSSPQSGSLKTGRTDYTRVLNSQIKNNRTVGLWFDQSNYDTTVAGNDIENNTGAGIFYEISDYLYAVNNYIKAGGRNGIEISASSNAYLANNTIVGGQEQVGIYVDSRSIAGCSDPSMAVCSGSYNSDRDNHRPHRATMTWMPSVNLMVNNIMAYPSSGSGYCGTFAGLCITRTNDNANVPINAIIHPADSANGIPQTFIDGNVYANGNGAIIATSQLGNYSTLSAFATALAWPPVNIGGLEVHGLSGNSYLNSDGSPTGSLAGLHGSAYAIPSDSNINPYVSAGTRHYGVLWK